MKRNGESRYISTAPLARARISTPELRTPASPAGSSAGRSKAWVMSAAKRVGIVSRVPMSKIGGRIYKRLSPRKSAFSKATLRSPIQSNDIATDAQNCGFSPAEEIVQSAKSVVPQNDSIGQPSVPTVSMRDKALHDGFRNIAPIDKPLPSVPFASFQTRSPVGRRSLIDASESPKSLGRPISPSPLPRGPIAQPALFRSPSKTLQNCSQALNEVIGMDCMEKRKPDSEAIHCDLSRDYQSKRLNLTALDDFPGRCVQASTVSNRQSSPSLAAPASITSDEEPRPDVLRPGLSNGGSSTLGNVSEGAAPVIGHKHIDPGYEPAASMDISIKAKKLASPAAESSPVERHLSATKASRLPRRTSTPGPVRGTSVPRSFVARRSSPYRQVQTSVSDVLSAHKSYSIPLRKLSTVSRPLLAPWSLNDATATENTTLLCSSFKQQQASSIPLPRYPVQSRPNFASRLDVPSPKPKIAPLKPGTHSKGDGSGRKLIAAAPEYSAILGFTYQGHGIRKSTDLDDSPYLGTEDNFCNSSSNNRASLLQLPSGLNSSTHRHDNSSPTEPKTKSSSPSGSRRTREQSSTSFGRVKRLSAAAPEYGPILRISSSAEKIIMGDEPSSHTKSKVASDYVRRSVPDLRRSHVIKELCRSTEGMLNGISPLTRSLTSRSLNQTDGMTAHSDFKKLKESQSEGYCSSIDSMSLKLSSQRARGRPQKSFKHSASLRGSHSRSQDRTPELTRRSVAHLSVEDCMSPEGTSWIPPLHAPGVAIVPQQDSVLRKRESDQDVATETVNKYKGASEAPPTQNCFVPEPGARSASNTVSTWSRGKAESLPVGSKDALVAPQISRFPHRLSSQANTPDLDEVRALVNQRSSTLDIPNRFESSRRKQRPREISPRRTTAADQGPVHDFSKNPIERPKAAVAAAARPSEVGRSQQPNAKRVFESFKGFFHRRQFENLATPSASSSSSSALGRLHTPHQDRATMMVSSSGSPYPTGRPRMLPPSDGADSATHYGPVTDLVARVLKSAEQHVDPTERTNLLLRGQLMAEAVTAARAAEKATEEAKTAATRAETLCESSRKGILELTGLMLEALDGYDQRVAIPTTSVTKS